MKRRPKVRPFDAVYHLNEEDMRQMFLSVSVSSLGEWLKYYMSKSKPAICEIIREVSVYRGIPASCKTHSA